MEASSAGSMSTGAKEDESDTGRIWAAGFHNVISGSRLADVLKLMNRLILEFSNFPPVCSEPWIQ
jgi:hypothetical protein